MVAPLAAGLTTFMRMGAARAGMAIGPEFLSEAESLGIVNLGRIRVLTSLLPEGEEEPGAVEITVPVFSEPISSIGCHAAGIITVTFKRGGNLTYEYPGTEEMFLAFLAAPSKGRWFNDHLR